MGWFILGFLCGMTAGGLGTMAALLLFHGASSDYYPSVNDTDPEVE